MPGIGLKKKNRALVTFVVIIALSMIGAVGFVGIIGLPLTAVFLAASNSTSCSPTSPGAPGTAPSNTTLFQAIKIDTNNNARLALGMFMGTNLESNWNDTAVGAGSYGDYQIQDPGSPFGPHPDISIAQAEDPSYSTNYMLGAYQSGLSKVSDSSWATSPELAGEETAFLAEGPAVPYHVNQGAARVHEAFVASIAAMQATGIPTNFGGTITLTVAIATTHRPTVRHRITAAPSPKPRPEVTAPPKATVKATPSRTSTPTPTASSTQTSGTCGQPVIVAPNGVAAAVVALATAEVGFPYIWGGGDDNGPTVGIIPGETRLGFDCSGLVMYAYWQGAHIQLPRTSDAQMFATNSHPVIADVAHLQPGDLLFYWFPGDNSAAGHVTMYVGNGMIVEASQPGVPVHVVPLYLGGLVMATRVINTPQTTASASPTVVAAVQ